MLQTLGKGDRGEREFAAWGKHWGFPMPTTSITKMQWH